MQTLIHSFISKVGKFLLLFALISNYTVEVFCQSEIFISNEQRRINKVDIAAGNCSQTTIVTTSVSLSDITLHPNGKMYGVNFTSRKLYEVNMTNGSVSELLTIPEADKLVGMTADANGLLYITEGDVVPSRLFVVDPVTNTYESKGFLLEGSAGDLTWYLGQLYNASDNNKLVRVNVENPESSVTIGTFTGIVKPNDRIFALVTVIAGCDNSITYGLSEFGDYYRLDMNTAIADRLCIANIDIYGSTSADEFSASECFVVLDLDKNNSSGAINGDYQDGFNCETTSSPIADSDTEILVSFEVDSLYISFTGGIEDDTEEYIEATPIPGININSAIHRIKAYNAGSATAEDFEDLLKNARYVNASFPATPGLRTLEVVAFSEGRSDTAFVEIELIGVYAGEDGSADFCTSSDAADLFTFIEGNPPNGGTWSPNLVSGTGVFNPAIDVSGTYYYYITDGCFLDSAAIEVTVSNGSTFSIGNDTTFCNATSFEIIPDVTDPDATYLWSTGSTDPTITVLVSGTYGVTVTIGDCESSAEIEVNFFSSTLDLGNDLSLCPGESTTLNADIGLPGTTYLWNTGATDPQITVADTGTYSVVVTNGSCQVEDDISIDFFTSSLDLGNDVEICNGDSLLLDADIGLAGATYTWSTGESTPQIYVSTAGNFSVSVVNGSCQEVDDIDISIINIDLELGNDVSICPNDSVLLDATVTDLTADYVWSTGATSPQIYASFEGIFSVTVTVGNCTVTDQVNVQEVSFTAPLGNDIQLCPGDSALLNADLGIADVTYLWSTGETSPQIYVDAAGNYSVVISNGDCDFQDDILVSISNGSEIPVNLGADQTICEGENIVLNSGYTTANYQHLWSDGSSGASITVSSAGIYFVNLSNSCQSGSDTIEIFIEDCDTIIGPIDTTNFEPPCQILFPTAFSPNNDGFNDQFGPVNICPEIESVSFRVYNRFGQEVFSGINTSWDGTFKNEIVPLDNFVWYATYLYSDGSIKDAHGNVVIVK